MSLFFPPDVLFQFHVRNIIHTAHQPWTPIVCGTFWQKKKNNNNRLSRSPPHLHHDRESSSSSHYDHQTAADDEVLDDRGQLQQATVVRTPKTITSLLWTTFLAALYPASQPRTRRRRQHTRPQRPTATGDGPRLAAVKCRLSWRGRRLPHDLLAACPEDLSLRLMVYLFHRVLSLQMAIGGARVQCACIHSKNGFAGTRHHGNIVRAFKFKQLTDILLLMPYKGIHNKLDCRVPRNIHVNI